MRYYKNAPCDGDCPHCIHADCIDEDGCWDYVKPEERRILNGPNTYERVVVANRVYRRKRMDCDQEFRARILQQHKESYQRRKQKAATGGTSSDDGNGK